MRQHPIALRAFAGLDVYSLVETRAAGDGGRPFLTWDPPDHRVQTSTFGQVHDRTEAVAAAMHARGVNRGDHVLVHLDNCEEFLLTWLACARLGAVAVTTNTRSAPAEMEYFITDCDAVAAVTQPRHAEMVATAGPTLRWIAITDTDAGTPPAEASRPSTEDRFATLEAEGYGREAPPRICDPTAPMCVLYTSGTTSRPKGVVWTHANALWAGRTNAHHETLRPDDCHLVYLPLFHANALGYGFLASLWAGARMVLLPKWSSSRFWEISLTHRCTWTSLIGLSFKAIAAMEPPQRHDYRMFGSPAHSSRLDQLLGTTTIGWYGMTETISHPIVGDPYLPNPSRTLGRPAPEYRVAVVGDDGAPTPSGESGNLLVSGVPGVSMFDHYLGKPEATAAAWDQDGWFHTGDRVSVRDDGYLVFADRAKDMLKVGGENVAASEIESAVLSSGAAIEVAAVGKPDPMLDEVAVAYVIPRDPDSFDPEALAAHCRRQLADFKLPREFIPVPALPRVTLGKVNKAALRDALALTRSDFLAVSRGWARPDD